MPQHDAWQLPRPAALARAPALRLYALSIDAQNRDTARLQVRAALAEMISSSLDVDSRQIALNNVRGQGMRARWQGVASASLPTTQAATLPQWGFSVAYEGQTALLAMNPHGSVGVDLVCIAHGDWRANHAHWLRMGEDYLPPLQSAQLQRILSFEEQAVFFTQAWAAHEAALKCLHLPLLEYAEYDTAQTTAMTTLSCSPLPTPAVSFQPHNADSADSAVAAALAWTANTGD